MFVIFIRDMFSDAGLAEVDMTKVTVALCYSGLTKVAPGHVLGTVIRIHFMLNLEIQDVQMHKKGYRYLHFVM